MENFFQNILSKLRAFGVEVYYLISSRIFLINFAKIAGIVAATLFLMFQWLTCFTRHNNVIKVGNYVGKNIKESKRLLEDAGFNLIITDSLFKENTPPDLVLDQNPAANSYVKKGRTIYIKITKSAGDLVSLPDIAGRDDINLYRQNLDLIGIHISRIDTIANADLTDGTILGIYVNDKDVTDLLKQGVRLPQGSSVSLKISRRETNDTVMPDLMCKSGEQASVIIDAMGLIVGSVKTETNVTNNNSAYVFKQEPAAGTQMKKGMSVVLFVTQTRPTDCPDNGFPE